mgnify:CR=1 FL=1
MKGALLAWLLAGTASAADYALPPPPPGPHVDYWADQIEFDETKKIFTRPKDKRTEDYVTGRFG